MYIPQEGSNLPAIRATVALTSYAIMEQDLSHGKWAPRAYLGLEIPTASRAIYLGLEIPTKADDIYVAWQEMEAFVRALAIEKQTSIAVQITRITDKPREWPKGIGFLHSRDFPQRQENWQPSDHHRDPKNRVRMAGYFGATATTAGRCSTLEKSHEAFSHHNEYQSELVKDYLAGLDTESAREPSLAMLYYYKVLERIGKKEYNNPQNRTLTNKTLNAIVADLNTKLTAEEQQRLRDISRWRHTKSEAHLVTEGLPRTMELGLCKKLAHLAILRRI